MPITIKDIAKRTGVNHSTVSRALHGSNLISVETAERIRKAAREMGYQPSAAARSLKTRRSKVLGVIVSSIEDPFFSEIVFGIEAVAQDNGYSLFIGSSQHDNQRERKIVQTMLEHRTDGVIVCSSSFSVEHGRQLLDHGFPIVVVNHQATENFHYSIFHDDIDGSRQMTRHLIGLGHQRIAYLGNSVSGRTTLDRLSGFQAEMEAAGLPIPEGYIQHVPGGTALEGREGLQHFNDVAEFPTAIICYNDMIAIGLLQACREAGIHVPQDLSITGFDNISFSAFTHPPLTTFDQPKSSIGAEAARLLLELIDAEPSITPETQYVKILKGSLLVRSSTASVLH